MTPFDKIIDFQIAHFDFGDKRLDRRCKESFYKIDNSGSSKSFPRIFQDSYQLKGFYRMINNKKVTPEGFFEGYNKGLIDYFRKEHTKGDDEFLFNYQDTTFGKYHQRKKLQLGYLQHPNSNGLQIHTGILTNSRYIPLGPSHQQIIIRSLDDFGKSKALSKRAFKNKESFKWTKGFSWAKDFSEQVNIPIVQVADREADLCDLFNFALELDQLFIIRSHYNRVVNNSQIKLWDYLKTKEESLQTVRTLIDRNGKKHEVNCTIRCAQVKFDGVSKPLWAVYLQAIEPPEHMEETQWMLLTNLPLEKDSKLILTTVDGYTRRWKTTEDFHKCLKTGCHIEERQFDSIPALKNSIALLSLSAIRLLRMRHLSEEAPIASVSQILDTEEIEVAELLSKEFLKPSDLKICKPKTILWWVLLLGRMGGHQGYKQKGLPGWQTMFKGWNYFQSVFKGVILSKNLFKPPS